MQISQQVDLTSLNTFGIRAYAARYAEFSSEEELRDLLRVSKGKALLILGGGSNILFTRDFPGTVLRNCIGSIEQLAEDHAHTWLRVGAGVNWHQFVIYCLDHNLAGVENLSLIPGTVGAAPMQNIGAYGMEIKEVLEKVECISREEGDWKEFDNAACKFGYRDSIFKNEVKDRFVITRVIFRLNKIPQFNISYGAIQEVLEARGVKELSIQAISEAVCLIRQTKLPDPAKIGNAGSFFKNPEISQSHLEDLKKKFPDIVAYPLSNEKVKIPAAWLIEKAGWKGKRFGEIGVHQQQALVLVNYGQGKGSEIQALAEKIKTDIYRIFGIALQMEVNVI